MHNTSFTVRKRENGKYQAIVRQKINGTWKQVESKGGFDKKIQGQQWANKRVAYWQTKVFNDYEKMSIGQLKLIYLDHIKNTSKESTYITAKSQLNKKELDDKIISQITPYQYKKFSDSCKFANLSRFSAFYNYLIEDLDMAIKNPFKNAKYKQLKKKDVIEADEFRDILELIKKSSIKEYQKERLILICKISYYAGLRIGEIIGLFDTDFINKNIRVNKQFSDKSHELTDTKSERGERLVPVPDHLWIDIIKFKSNQKIINIDKRIFQLKQGYAFELLRKCLKGSKYEGITFHYFRHSYISFLVKKGLDLNTVSYLAGDKLETIVKTYIHLTIDTHKIAENFIQNNM